MFIKIIDFEVCFFLPPQWFGGEAHSTAWINKILSSSCFLMLLLKIRKRLKLKNHEAITRFFMFYFFKMIFSPCWKGSIWTGRHSLRNRRNLGTLKYSRRCSHVSKFIFLPNLFIIFSELRFKNLRIIRGLHTKKGHDLGDLRKLRNVCENVWNCLSVSIQ